MNFADAAERVLEEAGGGPLHSREILQRAIGLGLVSPRGAAPIAYMASAIRQDARRRAAKGARPRFAVVGRGYFRLSRVVSNVEAAVEAQNRQQKEHLQRRLGEMEPVAFEELVGELLERLGFEDVEVTSRTSDGGIDVRAVLNVEGLTRVPTAIQVKRWKRNVGSEVVQNLRGSLNVDERGLIITTSGFTRRGVDEASASGRQPIGLVDGSTLVDLMAANDLGFKRREFVTLEVDEEMFAGRLEDELVEQGAAIQATERSASARAMRFAIFRMPGGMPHLAALEELLKVAVEVGNQEALVEAIQHRWPQITRSDVATRHSRVLIALGLITIESGRIELTGDGEEFLRTRSPRLILKLLLERAYGAQEIVDLLEMGPLDQEELVKSLQLAGLTRMTPTQVRNIGSWLRELGLITKTKVGLAVVRNQQQVRHDSH